MLPICNPYLVPTPRKGDRAISRWIRKLDARDLLSLPTSTRWVPLSLVHSLVARSHRRKDFILSAQNDSEQL